MTRRRSLATSRLLTWTPEFDYQICARHNIRLRESNGEGEPGGPLFASGNLSRSNRRWQPFGSDSMVLGSSMHVFNRSAWRLQSNRSGLLPMAGTAFVVDEHQCLAVLFATR